MVVDLIVLFAVIFFSSTLALRPPLIRSPVHSTKGPSTTIVCLRPLLQLPHTGNGDIAIGRELTKGKRSAMHTLLTILSNCNSSSSELVKAIRIKRFELALKLLLSPSRSSQAVYRILVQDLHPIASINNSSRSSYLFGLGQISETIVMYMSDTPLYGFQRRPSTRI
jgi:hypothetical protein